MEPSTVARVIKTKRKRLSTQQHTRTPAKRRKPAEAKKYLQESHKALYAELHPTKNVGIATDKLTKGSTFRLWWKCSNHTTCDKHEWETTVNSRTNSKSGCPFCVGRVKKCECPVTKKAAAPKRLFKDEFANLVCEINLALNPDINLSELTFQSNKPVVWTCIQHTTCDEHSWRTSGQQQK
jgi:hypothetical protein